VPDEIAGHAAVRNHARRVGAKSSEILLDRSYHHAAMRKLEDSWKRGRPDIVHFALMEALSTPLFIGGMLRVYVHTTNDKVIAIADNLRIPKSYFRFEGLMVNLFRDKEVKSDGGAVLMELSDATFAELVDAVKADKIIGLSTAGVRSNPEKVASSAKDAEDCAFVIGGFPKGHFSQKVTKHLGPTYSIGDMGLEAHVVVARLLYECEKLLEKGVDHERDEQRGQVGA
jgi:rRNA small subunit pseudouridine methyltransferase Nep1